MTDHEEFGERPAEMPAESPLPRRRRRTTRSISSSTPAGHGARFAAACIDLALWVTPPVGLGILAGTGVFSTEMDPILTVVGYGYVVVFLVQATLLTVRSQSLGKMALNLRIVRHDDETRPGFIRIVVVRMLVVGFLSALSNVVTLSYPLFPFFVVDSLFAFRSDRRCLHDLMAETKVIAGKPGQVDLRAFD